MKWVFDYSKLWGFRGLQKIEFLRRKRGKTEIGKFVDYMEIKEREKKEGRWKKERNVRRWQK